MPAMSADMLALVAFRAVAVAFAVFALVQAVCNVLETLSDFDAAHLGYFLRSRLLRPGVTFLVACLLWAAAPGLAALASRGV